MPCILSKIRKKKDKKNENKKTKYIIEIIKADVIEAIKPDTLNYTKTYIKDNIIVSF